jgi:Tol biopolymer transport system component
MYTLLPRRTIQMKTEDSRLSPRHNGRQSGGLVHGAFVAVALASALLAVQGSAQNVVSGSNGKIAFDRDGKNGQNNIWVMNPDGSGQTQLTQSGYNSSAAWSPDGTMLAFQRSTNGGIHFEIYVMRADGTGLTQLTINATNSSFNPTWSPDGAKIAFGNGPDGGSASDIYVINSNGSGSPTNLTSDPTHFNVSPAWSPDSNKIAFYTNRDGLSLFHIYVMNSDGANPYAQTTGSFDFTPTWSPDGTQIAFASSRSGNSNDIYVMSATTVESGANIPVDLSNVGAFHSAIRPNWAVVPTPCKKKVCHF